MSDFLKEIRLYLFIYQWFIFLSIFLFYLKAADHHYGFFYVLIGLYLVYTLIFCYAYPRKSWLLLGLFDLSIALYIIVQTGKWNSPFMLYAYTTLLWLGLVVRTDRFVTVVLLFLVAYFILPAIFPNELLLPSPLLDQLRFMLDVITWSGLAFLFVAVLKNTKKLYGSFFRLCLFQNRLAQLEQPAEVCELTEKLVKRVLGSRHAHLCLFQEWELDGDWRRQFFLHSLLEAGAESFDKPGTIRLTDFMGKESAYFSFPLWFEQQSWGVLLVQSEKREGPSRWQQLWLKMVTAIVIHQRKQIRRQYDQARTLHQEMQKKLAQDMHDGLAQQLFFLSAQLFQIKQSLPPDWSERLGSKIEQMEQRIQWCHGEVRSTITHLRDNRHSSHIFDAVEQLLKRMTLGADIHVDYSTRGRITEEHLPVMDAVYRIVEEATANVLKHAKASVLQVSVDASPVQYTVRVKDNGIGFLIETVKQERYGVMGMRERVAKAGGTLHILSKPNEGTEIVAIIPRKAVEMYG
ncbi:sensor histidine kinase [Brevibacillus sp. H7]|uniref:sensor histidine kinase n=1 Tax=Brevibacillus sp. H7 TaxID=3349138 RepID=UPI0038191AE3